MAATNEDRERQVVPRWRSFASATQFREIGPLKTRARKAFDDSLLSHVLEDWRREPGMSVAADVVSAAVAIGCHAAAGDAAKFLLKQPHAPSPARELAQRCLEDRPTSASAAFLTAYGPTQFDEIEEAIHGHRHRLVEYPRNPVLWTNLSLLFTTAGLEQKARRAMQVALGLAPDNRFVARAASRLYLHQGDPIRAHDVILRTPSLKGDPWLLAAEIAAASASRRHSQQIKRGRNVVESRDFSPFDLSELACGIATLEAYGGSLKKSRQFCTISMKEPSENAVAQAAWLSRKFDSAAFEPLIPRDVSSSEACSWNSRESGNWVEAVRFSTLWQCEQPFSSRPAMFGSYAASVGMEDFAAAEKIAKQGLSANRNDTLLINNLAFALAKQDRVNEARDILQRALLLPQQKHQMITLRATEGLIEFREGNAAKGRQLYTAAIAGAVLAHCEATAAIAQAYLAVEEARIRSPFAASALREASGAIEKLPEPLRAVFVGKVKRASREMAR